MSAASSIHDNRKQLYTALTRRNNRVKWFRVGVPIFGALVLVGLLVQIIAASIVGQFLPDGMRIERDNLVIDAPTYSGVMRDGSRYTIISEAAEAAIGGPDVVNLKGARIEVIRLSGEIVVAEAEKAQFSFSSQQVKVPGLLHVTNSDGLVSVLENTIFDWSAQTMDTKKDVHMVLADGSTLTAQTMHHDAGETTWDFQGNVKLIVPGKGDSQ